VNEIFIHDFIIGSLSMPKTYIGNIRMLVTCVQHMQGRDLNLNCIFFFFGFNLVYGHRTF